ncbi:uncharacterized protein LOC122009620 [Zingiber officinale]|uniref:uncharacterized protein LOC122009620 n=1 Tax=Zingiber officinale TaxID=94328 RepID=UPI001C4B888B|nr:uncharacterized protein LOC122009620 [Zingiber officinale]XP_042421781.1 uncharacterized protein LOC122009620 [Zingiber officinale]
MTHICIPVPRRDRPRKRAIDSPETESPERSAGVESVRQGQTPQGIVSASGYQTLTVPTSKVPISTVPTVVLSSAYPTPPPSAVSAVYPTPPLAVSAIAYSVPQIPVPTTTYSTPVPAVPPIGPAPVVPSVPAAVPTHHTDIVAARARIPALAESMKSRFTLFRGETDPSVAQSWIETMERTFFYMTCFEWEKAELIVFYLLDEVDIWWDVQRSILGEHNITWARFREAFESRYLLQAYQTTRRQDFLNLRQNNCTVTEYNAKFNRLVRFCPELVAEDRSRMLQFILGLDGHLQVKLAGFGSSSYLETLDRALMIELA